MFHIPLLDCLSMGRFWKLAISALIIFLVFSSFLYYMAQYFK